MSRKGMDNKNPDILVVDNYDSFTYNLVQIINEHGNCHYDVIMNDRLDMADADRYDGFLFSPGPGRPSDAPVMNELLRLYHKRKSFLGICLGHQAIAEAFGLHLVNLPTVRHGTKTKIRIVDPSDYLFSGLPANFIAGLYHSWAVSDDGILPESSSQLRVTARSSDDIIMAIAHNRYDIRGVQFHPESYLTEHGPQIIINWIDHLKSTK